MCLFQLHSISWNLKRSNPIYIVPFGLVRFNTLVLFAHYFVVWAHDVCSPFPSHCVGAQAQNALDLNRYCLCFVCFFLFFSSLFCRTHCVHVLQFYSTLTPCVELVAFFLLLPYQLKNFLEYELKKKQHTASQKTKKENQQQIDKIYARYVEKP